ncbi:MAG: hypothetical protein HRT37_19665 [Alteromonadaceae bacterium]|nr:hypothetical protein [Alteromonadaceae bacterium]
MGGQAILLLLPELQPQLSRLFPTTILNDQMRYNNEKWDERLSGQSIRMLSLMLDEPETEISIMQKQTMP